MGKIFNIAGPCCPDRHYMLPASARLPQVMRLVDDEAYFVVHAPRQSGKTTAFQALVDAINERGERIALYCSVENAQGVTDPLLGMRNVRDYQARIRPDSETLGSASPFNVITEAKERIIRERGTHVDSLMERMKEPRVRHVVEPVMLGGGSRSELDDEDVSLTLDLGVKFRGATYPVEVKMRYNYEKSHERAYDQVVRYVDHLGEREGWLVVVDPDLTKPWEEKIGRGELVWKDRAVHVVRC